MKIPVNVTLSVLLFQHDVRSFTRTDPTIVLPHCSPTTIYRLVVFFVEWIGSCYCLGGNHLVQPIVIVQEMRMKRSVVPLFVIAYAKATDRYVH